MAIKTTFSEQELADILALYDFGAYERSTPFTRGTIHTNLLLQTTMRRCVLRYYEQGRTVNAITFEINLLRYLKSRQYPCPGPLRNRQGRYLGMHRTKPYVLFEFLEGQHVQTLSEHQRQQLIQKAAELHILTSSYRPTYKAERWNYSVELCHRLAEQAAAPIDTASAREKLQWHSYELAQLQLPQSLPKGICHADFDPSNILFNDETLAALIDFDDANYTFLLFDLVGLINIWAWPYDDVVLNLAEASKIVADYARHRSLNPTEKRHLFDVFKLSILIDCVWNFARGDVGDFYEKKKIDHLHALGRAQFYDGLFGD